MFSANAKLSVILCMLAHSFFFLAFAVLCVLNTDRRTGWTVQSAVQTCKNRTVMQGNSFAAFGRWLRAHSLQAGIGEPLSLKWLDQRSRTRSTRKLPDLVISLVSIRVSAGKCGERYGRGRGGR